MIVNKRVKGFTLIEILAVIVILGVLIGIGIVAVNKITEDSKQKAAFTSVSNIVNAIKVENIMNENDFCMYSYKEDKENQTPDIYNMYVIAHKANNKIIYSVYAEDSENNELINAYDFSLLRQDKKSEWIQEDEKSYTIYAHLLFQGIGNGSIKNMTICDLK